MDISELKEQAANYIEPLLNSPLFAADKTSDPGSLAASYFFLDKLEKLAKKKKESLRSSLLAWAEVHGSPTEKGGSIAEIESFSLTREKRTGKQPEAKAMQELLQKHGLKISDAFVEVKKMELSPTKVAYLVESGRLTEEEVEGAKKVSFALKVRGPEELL